MDVVDMAYESQEIYLKTAFANQQCQARKIPLIINGIRRCLDCENPIPIERLEIQPDAVRCVACQNKYNLVFKS